MFEALGGECLAPGARLRRDRDQRDGLMTGEEYELLVEYLVHLEVIESGDP